MKIANLRYFNPIAHPSGLLEDPNNLPENYFISYKWLMESKRIKYLW